MGKLSLYIFNLFIRDYEVGECKVMCIHASQEQEEYFY